VQKKGGVPQNFGASAAAKKKRIRPIFCKAQVIIIYKTVDAPRRLYDPSEARRSHIGDRGGVVVINDFSSNSKTKHPAFFTE
jgi:hypothetical protein